MASINLLFTYKTNTYSIQVDASKTISELKQTISEELKSKGNDVPASSLKLIFSAKILKDNNTVEDCGLKQDSKVFVSSSCIKKEPQIVKEPTSQHSSTNSFYQPTNPFMMPNPGMGQDPNLLSELARSQIQSYIQNPNILDYFFPHLFANKTEEEKAELKKTLIAQFQAVMENPQMMNMMVNQLNNQMSGNPNAFAMNDFQNMFGPMSPGMMGNPNMMNPNMMNPNMMNPNMMNPNYMNPNMMNPNMMNQASPISPTIPCSHGFYPLGYQIPENVKEKYQEQLKALKDMGFNDEEECLKALFKSHGDVNAAVEILIQNMGK